MSWSPKAKVQTATVLYTFGDVLQCLFQPKYYSAGGVGGGGRRRGLKEAFRAARPGASCPQAWASGCPTGDLRWPGRRGVVVGSLGEGGAICRGFWWPPACLASPGVGRCDPPPQGQPAGVQRGKVPPSDVGRVERQEDAMRDRSLGGGKAWEHREGWIVGLT